MTEKEFLERYRFKKINERDMEIIEMVYDNAMTRYTPCDDVDCYECPFFDTNATDGKRCGENTSMPCDFSSENKYDLLQHMEEMYGLMIARTPNDFWEVEGWLK